MPADEISPIWGLSYRDISLEGYLHHRSQGVTPFLNSPFLRRPYGLKQSTGGAPSPSDFAQPLMSLARVIPVPSEDALAAADRSLDEARMAAEKLDWPGAVRSIAEAGKQIATLEDQVKGSHGSRRGGGFVGTRAGARANQSRLRRRRGPQDHLQCRPQRTGRRRRFQRARRNRPSHDLPATFSKPELSLPSGWSITKQEEKDGSTNFSVAVPAGAQTPHTPGDFLYPFPPPLVHARTHVEADGYAFDFTAPVESLHATTVTVLNYPLRIVPPVELTPEPEQYVVVESRQPKAIRCFRARAFFCENAVEGQRGG